MNQHCIFLYLIEFEINSSKTYRHYYLGTGSLEQIQLGRTIVVEKNVVAAFVFQAFSGCKEKMHCRFCRENFGPVTHHRQHTLAFMWM